MTRTLTDPHSVPAELRPYLEELVHRTHTVCGPHLVSVLAVGSVALGDYRHGRSDTDVTVVVDPSLPGRALPELAAALAHPALPCPAAGLELVVYAEDFAARPSGAAGYLLDLNTGPLLPERVSLDPSESPAFWYVIDRSVAHQAGRVLYGSPARAVIAEPARTSVLTAIRASVREHSAGEGHLADNRVLNGCRSVVYCRTGRWAAKRRAAQAVAASEERFRPLLAAALRSFERPSRVSAELPAAEVQAFLSWVAERVDETIGLAESI
ncbi:aminoglycoside adenylyltransferase domain-containing protein [Streptomyces curacoi]|uniref:Translation initiation factor 2 n=1 Tax=Streptomyces curacoi TaxID=146536 RepID=A0A117P5B5_9ACTN|nr:aminoglycoside adenylyltransferase domain-containing protein [Streptomyces curacoi]KUM73358.1 translation initiation factor 2 [Streptomyces curacoi]